MAERILKHALIEMGKTDCVVSSAGLGALTGHQADPIVRQLMMQKGLDISDHHARQLTSEMIRAADLILVMETWQKAEIEAREPSAKGKVFRLGEWGKFDISDPYQKDLSDFIQSMALIDQGVAQWVTKL
jgi:protein-tyrosine phosphatase